MRKMQRATRGTVPQGHDCCSQRNTGNGVEVGKVGEHKMDRGIDHDEVGKLDVFAVFAHQTVEFM